MSAYGDIKRTNSSIRLTPTIWNSQSYRVSDSPAISGNISVHHFTLTTARALPGLLEYLGAIFAKEVADGMTYPQEEDMEQDKFEAYFFSADVFVGIVSSLPRTIISGSGQPNLEIEEERTGRTWNECIAGYYYVSIHFTSALLVLYKDYDLITISNVKIKPNYPGRSSHVSINQYIN